MGDLKRSLVRNTFFNALGYCWTLLIGFLVTPILIHFIGLKTYGLYILYGSILAWLWILDLGLSTAATRSLSHHAADGKEDLFWECLNTTITIKLAVGLFIAGSAFLGSDLLSNLPGMNTLPGTGPVLRIMALSYAISNFSQAYTAALAARQRMDIPNRLGMFISIPATAVSVTALALGMGLEGFLAVNLAASTLYLALARSTLRRISPSPTIPTPFFSRLEFRELLGFSWKQSFNRMADTFLTSADRLILGSDFTAISRYQLGATIGWRIREFTATSISAAFPAATDLFAREDWTGLNQMFRRGTKFLSLLAFPPMLFATIFAEEILTFWLGGLPPDSALVLRLLAIGYFVNVLAALSATVAAAADRLDLHVRSSAASVVAVVILYGLMGRHHGLPGLAASVSAGFALLGILLIVQVCVHFRGRLALPVQETICRPLAATLLAAAPATILGKWYTLSQGCPETRPRSGVFLAIIGVIAAILFPLCLKWLRVLEDQDRELIRSIFRRAIPSRAPGSPP
jgi:O-antigen/teichoic acid export membrane protein